MKKNKGNATTSEGFTFGTQLSTTIYFLPTPPHSLPLTSYFSFLIPHSSFLNYLLWLLYLSSTSFSSTKRTFTALLWATSSSFSAIRIIALLKLVRPSCVIC